MMPLSLTWRVMMIILLRIDKSRTWEVIKKGRRRTFQFEMEQNHRMLIYALVARGSPPVVLAEYAAISGNFDSIAYQCLQKLPSSNNSFTYNCNNHTFNYLLHDGFTYCVVAEESAGILIPSAFLERIKDDFVSKYSGGKAAMVPENGLNKVYGPMLKEHMQYCVEHPEEISKLAKLKAQVSEIKGVMMENIEKILDRGERIELLVDKTEDLHHQAQEFRATGIRLHRKTWLQSMKVKLVVLAIVIALILIIVFSACKGFKNLLILSHFYVVENNVTCCLRPKFNFIL